MSITKRKTGIQNLEDCPWGTHFSLFYENKEDLLEILVPYFKVGLENNEYCMWITSGELSYEEIKSAMRAVLPNFDYFLKEKQIEIISAKEWYLLDDKVDFQRTLDGWIKKIDLVLSKGYDGLRVTGNSLWVEKKDRKGWNKYEKTINEIIPNYKMLAICSYSLNNNGTSEIINAVNSHQFALAKSEGVWEKFKNSEEVDAKQKLKVSKFLLKERLKELRCLYEISKIIEGPYISIKKILYETLRLIPIAFQFPEITCARITYNKKIYNSENFKEAPWKISNNVKVNRRHFQLEVYYRENKPFLQEETSLINEIVNRLKITLIQKEALQKVSKSKKELKLLNFELEEKVKARTRKLKESQEKYQFAYEQAKLYKDLFAHDINNILQNITTSSEILSFQLDNREKLSETEELIELIRGQVKRGIKLVTNIQKLSQLDENKTSTKKIELFKYLSDAIDFIDKSFQNKEVKITVNSASDKEFVNANDLLLDIFENLFVNSIKYNENLVVKILVKISTVQKTGIKYIKIEIIDNGVGVPDDRKKRVFQRGYKNRDISSGMGLGLSLVKNIVESYEGQLMVEDRVKGDYSKGSNFIILIPKAY
jgi:signal transduction histidine kinase